MTEEVMCRELSGFEIEDKKLILYFRKEAGYDTEIGFITLKVGDNIYLETKQFDKKREGGSGYSPEASPEVGEDS